MSDLAIITFALIAAVAGIAYGLYLAMWVFKLNAGNAKMQEISKAIQEGARRSAGAPRPGPARRPSGSWRQCCSSCWPVPEPFPISSAF